MVEIENLVIGKQYKVNHRRKGTFNMMIEDVGDEWVTGEITDGSAHYIASKNGEKGDILTIRASLCEFLPIEECDDQSE